MKYNQNQKFKFSIIVPVYNVEEYLKECIDSVRQQTYLNWELILINDGSSDNSGEICDFYKNIDERIQVYHWTNHGVLLSRCKGIEMATGNYIVGLDSDDYFEKDALEKIVMNLEKQEYDLIMYYIHTFGEENGEIKIGLNGSTVYSKEEVLDMIIKETNHSLSNKVIRTSLVKSISKEYNKFRELSINLDYLQLIPIVCQVSSAIVIKEPLYNYRILKKSISHTQNPNNIIDTAIVTEEVINILEEFQLATPDRIRLCYEAFLKMISSRILKLIISDIEEEIKIEYYRKIYLNEIYNNARKYENSRICGFKNYIILKLFRYKKWNLIKWIYNLRN